MPGDFVWPFQHEEPLLFLAQINCAEVDATSFGLPNSGLLAFFGDHDHVNGCGPVGGGAVYYFRELRELAPADPPLEDFEPHVSCGMSFYRTYELPHLYSCAIEGCGFSKAERSAYIDLRVEISKSGFPNGHRFSTELGKLMYWDDISKMFGWPDLIQFGHDPGRMGELLLQLGDYHDGSEWHNWGPGGLVYFAIEREDLKARRFDRVELDMECT